MTDGNSQAFQKGDEVKIIIDEIDPDMNLHGKKGEIINIEFDDAASVTGNPKDNFMYTIELENGEVPDFRRKDIKEIES